MKIDDAIHRIRSFAMSQGWSVHRLAKEAGVNWETVNGIFTDPEWSTTVRKLRQIERVVPDGYVPQPPDYRPPPPSASVAAE